MTYHLIAFAANCTSIERAEVEWTLASQGPDGNWYDWSGHRYYPFHTQPIECPDLLIPPEWIDHIQDIAAKNAAKSLRARTMTDIVGANEPPEFDLSAMMNLHTTRPAAKPFLRRM